MSSLAQLEAEYNQLEENNSWMDAFQGLRSPAYESVSFSNAKHSMNIKYNRYRDILPYDHSRVKLKGMNDTDYINANLVECQKANRVYILAQAPLNHTREHFWQMVWEQNSLGIVMLNRLFEKGTQKCEMYYPNLDEENAEMTLEFGKFRLNYLSERTFKDFSIRTIECENLEEKRIVYHCHFTNWPDFGEPEYPTTFLMFLHECEQLDIFNGDLYGPCVVHCSAGVGRSGTFILVDSMLQLLRKYGDETPLGMSDLLSELRTFRMALVQTPQQLRFAYRAIIEAMKPRDPSSMLHDDEETSGATTNGFVDGDSQQQTTESDEIEDDNDADSDEATSSSDEDFYEGEDDDDDSKRSQAKRPNTARPSGKVAKLKLSSKTQKKIKNLRQMQLKHRGLNEQNLIKTAVGKARSGAGRLLDSDEEDNDNVEEKPFDRRDVQTVKVNQPRQPLAESKTPISAEPTTSSQPKRPLSDKDARIAQQIRTIKEKQKEQETRKHMFELYRPWLICGGVVLGGIVLQQIFKRLF